MALDVSKQVANSLAQTREVVSSIENHGPLIIEPLLTKLSKYASTDKFSPADFFKMLIDYLNGTANALREADIALALERSDDPKFRDIRDSLISSLIQTISKARAVLNESALLAYGISGKTPDTPDALISYGRKIVTLIKEKPEAVNDKPTDGDSFVTVNTESMIQTIKKGIDAIELALNDVKREERNSQAAMEQRDKLQVDWKTGVTCAVSFMENFCQMADKNELGDRIRSSSKKSSSEEPAGPSAKNQPPVTSSQPPVASSKS